MTKLANNFILIQLCLLTLSGVVQNYTGIIIIEALLIFFLVLNKLGKGIILRELIALHTTFVLLLTPLLGYLYYTIDNPLAKTWVKYMPVDESIYFSFVYPTVLVYNLILCWPISSAKKTDEGSDFNQWFDFCKQRLSLLKTKPKILILVGSIAYFLQFLLPLGLQYIGYLFFTSSFVGFLMLYSNPNEKYRLFFMLYFIAFIMYASISSGMFTIVVYMGMTISSFIFLNFKLSTWRKFALIMIAMFLIITLQNVKGAFRASMWENSNNQNSTLYLGQLLLMEATDDSDFFSTDRLFSPYVRTNQGFIVAKVINYIPSQKEYDNGAYLKQAIFSSLIPRFLWPDKPMAGGRFTMKYFTGVELVGNTSMNVGPVGEAYGSFGPRFGTVYMAFLALFIRWAYVLFLLLAKKVPFLIFWLPVIFFQITYSMETDSLQIFNSIVKSSIFVFVIYLINPSLFGIEKKNNFITHSH